MCAAAGQSRESVFRSDLVGELWNSDMGKVDLMRLVAVTLSLDKRVKKDSEMQLASASHLQNLVGMYFQTWLLLLIIRRFGWC